jgi:hypothetical protein
MRGVVTTYLDRFLGKKCEHGVRCKVMLNCKDCTDAYVAAAVRDRDWAEKMRVR